MGDRIVLGVPGCWKDRSDLIAAIARGKGYLAAGGTIIDLASKTGFGFEVYDRDPNMTQAFRNAGQQRLSEDLLARIDRHTLTAYIVCPDRGRNPARQILRVASYLLDVGGLAVKVESSGVAHAPDKWRYLAGSPSTLSLYEALVVLVGSKEYYYSCGMNSFGLPDASVTAQVSVEQGAEVLTAFNHRQLIQGTTLQDGDEFSLAIQEPAFRIRKVPYGYDEEDLLNNPHGRWHLELTPRRATLAKELNAGGAPLFMAIPGDDPRLQEAVRKARQTSGYFVASFQSPHEYGIHLFKAAFPDRDRKAYLWLALVEVRGQTLVGEVFEAPAELKVRPGQRVEVKLDEIHDWSIRKSGTVIGGFTLRLNREWIKPHLQRDWDLFTGIVNFAPVEEIVS